MVATQQEALFLFQRWHGSALLTGPRSGLAAKHMIDIGAGVIDPDYTGEIKVVIFNHSHSACDTSMIGRVRG